MTKSNQNHYQVDNHAVSNLKIIVHSKDGFSLIVFQLKEIHEIISFSYL